ncbi:MAG: transglycosylase [Alphaproteobacteria bacterium]|nr:transglycosylase [Alphaproteobacteria bacterium]MDB5721527.1 transglycosylase [Alphaproteobacteria bacterium]
MGLIILLVVGAVVGWIASMIMRTGGGILFDIVVGIVGALIAGFLFGGGASIINAPLNIYSVLYSLLGAIILLAIIKLIRRGSSGRI